MEPVWIMLRALAGAAPPPPRSARRIWIEAAIWGSLVGLACYVFAVLRHSADANDFQGPLRIARALFEGTAPYDVEATPLFIPYPLTAGLLSFPFLLLPDLVAGCVFIGITAGLMVGAFLRAKEDWRILALLSWCGVYTIWWMQWSFAMTALWYLPGLAVIALAKPQIAIPVILAGEARRRLLEERRWLWIVAPVVLFLLSLYLYPRWIPDWLAKIAPYQGKVPPLLSLPFGPLILLVLPAWRDRRCWLILGLAAFPQRMAYDQLPLLLAASTPRELLVFLAASWVNFALYRFYFHGWDNIPGGWQNLVVPTLYLPMALVVAWPVIRGWFHRTPASTN